MELYDPTLRPGLRLSNFVSQLIVEGKREEAICVAIGACELEPNRLEPFVNLAGAYEQVRGLEEYQIAAARYALDLPEEPEDPFEKSKRADAWHNLSLAQNRLYQWEDAFESAHKAHMLNPSNPWTLGHAAQCANQLGDPDLAVMLLTGALSLIEGEGSPFLNNPTPIMQKFRRDTRNGRAISKLEKGDLPGYFADYAHRFECGRLGEPAVDLYRQGKLWRPGQPIGKRVVIVLEGGLGDQIQFIRLAGWLPKGTVIDVVASPLLEPVVKTMGLVSDLVAVEDITDETVIASMDLVEWFHQNRQTLHPFGEWTKAPFGEWTEPYIHVNETADIGREPGKIAIAFCYAGNPDNNYDWARSIDLQSFLNWAETQRNRATFHSVQFGQKLVELPEWVEDCARPKMSDLAAVLNAADVLIGPDTGVLHLAGAMGRPAIMLHSFHQEWRWRLGTKIYGSNFRHLKQRIRGDWQEVLSRVGPELDNITPSQKGVEAMAH